RAVLTKCIGRSEGPAGRVEILKPVWIGYEKVALRLRSVRPLVDGDGLSVQLIRGRDRQPASGWIDRIDEVLAVAPDAAGREPKERTEGSFEPHVVLVDPGMGD